MKVPLIKSLRLQMPLLVLAGVVPLMLLAIFYASARAAKTIRIEARENFTLKADLLAEAVSRWKESNILALANLSKQPEIVSMNPTRQKPVLTNLVENYKHVYLAFTLNADGWNVTRSDNLKPKYFADRSYFKGAMSGNEISYQSLIGRTSKKLAVCMAAPIARQQIKIVGAAVICTDLKTLREQVGKLKFGETGYAILVDRSGMVLAHPDSKFISGKELKNLSTYPPVKNLLQNNDRNFSFTDSSGIRWVSYSSRLDNGWGLVLLQTEAPLGEPVVPDV